MHPTITEQLDGLRRILAEAVAPEVTAPYPAEILGGVIGALSALQASLHTVPPFLRWDIETTRRTALLDWLTWPRAFSDSSGFVTPITVAPVTGSTASAASVPPSAPASVEATGIEQAGL